MIAISRVLTALRRDASARLLGMCMLLATLDPVRVSREPVVQWIVGATALVAGCWAAPPMRERPILPGYKFTSRIARNRNTLLVCACVLLAATASPPTWLRIVDVVLVLSYLSLLDARGEAPGMPLRLDLHSVAAWVATGVVLAAALAPVNGGWWGRLVAAASVLLIGALMYVPLRLSRPATYHRSATEKTRQY